MCKRFCEELQQKPPWPWLTDTCSGAKKQSGIGLLQARDFFFYWFLSSHRADVVGLQKSKLMKTKMVACQPMFASISKEEHKHCLRELLFPSKTNELLKCHGSEILLIYIKGILLVNLKWSVINEKWFLLPILELGCGAHCAGFWGTESFLKEKKICTEIPSLSFPWVLQEAYPAWPADFQSPYLGHLLNTFTDEYEKHRGEYCSPFLVLARLLQWPFSVFPAWLSSPLLHCHHMPAPHTRKWMKGVCFRLRRWT